MKTVTKKQKSFIQWFISIFAVVFLGFVSFVINVNTVFAATVNTGVTGLTADSSGSGTWTYNNGAITGSVSPSGGCDSSSQNGTLTFTNSSGETALLSFDYSLALNGGSAKIDNAAVTVDSSFSKKLDNGNQVAVYLASAADGDAASISISNIKLTAEQNVTVTFNTAPNGSYTVNGESISVDNTTKTFKTTDTVALIATPASGYKFVGWYDSINNLYLSTKSTFNSSFIENITVNPEFAASNTAIWDVDSNLFNNFDNAITYANNNNISKITLISSGTLAAGNYEIPNGKMVLIPFDEAKTVYTTTPEVIYNSHVNPSAFCVLTLSSGANLVVNGELCVNSKLCAVGTGSGSYNGSPTGPGGRICMRSESTITINSGGALYCYGFIYGYKVSSTNIEDGTVIAESGSTVYEAMQFRCWRGGTASSGMLSGVFPMNQYYVQSIECSLKIKAGAREYVYTSANTGAGAHPGSALFIGKSSDSAMFTVSSGFIVKKYNSIRDYLEITVEGTVRIYKLTVKIQISIDTSNYTALPITNNISITAKSGSTINIDHNLSFLPGSEFIIETGATVNIGSNYKVYVYDLDEWTSFGSDNKVTGNYFAAPNYNIVPVGYSVNNGTTNKRLDNSTATRSTCTTVDAKFDVNGTLNVSGYLYTTSSGANIISSQGTGKIVMSRALSNTTIKEATQSSSTITEVTINVTPAKLKNGSGYETPFTDATEAKTYFYNAKDDDKGYWGDEETPNIKYTINYRDINGNILMTDTPVQHQATTYYVPGSNSIPLLDGFTIKKWVGIDNDLELDLNQPIVDVDFGANVELNFEAFYGGWDNTNTHYYSFEDGSLAKGLYEIEYILNNAEYDEPIQNVKVYVGDKCLFDETTGLFDSTTKIYHNNDGYYYIDVGVVGKDAGLVYIDTDGDFYQDTYYYIDENGLAYTNTYHYVSKINGLSVNPGFYGFANDGKMIYPVGSPDHITSNIVKDSSNNTVYGYGLFALTTNSETHLYYCKQNGEIVRNETFYVSIVNDYYVTGISSEEIDIKPGLYFFDNDGYMWYGNELLDGTTANFDTIVAISGSSGNGITIGRRGN